MPVSKSVASSGTVLRALALLQRYVGELNNAAEACVGPTLMAHADVDVLRLINESGAVSPSQMVERLGRPRSSLARGLARLRDEGLLERQVADDDARRAEVRLSSAGRGLVARLNKSIGDAMEANANTVREILRLLDHTPTAGDDLASLPLSTLSMLTAALSAVDREAAAALQTLGVAEGSDRAGLIFLAEQRMARPTHLSRHLRLSPAGATSLLNRLASNGLLIRHEGSTDDGRAVVLTLTARGRRATRLYVAAFVGHQEAILDALVLTLPRPALASSQASRA